MVKYFSVRIIIFIITFIFIVSLVYIVFEFANMKIWYRNVEDSEMLKWAFENYLVFAKGVFTENDWGDYGHTTTVWKQVIDDLPVTLKLNSYTLIVFVTLGISLGFITAYFYGTWIDKLISYSFVVLGSVPEYISIALLIIIFGYMLGWAPTYFDPKPESFSESFYGIALPVAALSILPTIKIMKMLRGELIEEMGKEYIDLVRCKGFNRFYAMRKHALRNSIGPVITEIPYLFGLVVSISFVVEIAFGIRGVAYQLQNSVIRVGEIPYILVSVPIAVLITAFYVLSVMLVSFVGNIILVIVDPTISLGKVK